jgi:putative nucleotidyltransferase with HDIG domain
LSDQPKSPAPGYKAVDIQTFRNASRDLSFDVYLKLSEDNYAHIFSRSTGLDYQRLAQYIQKGLKELYVKNEELEAYQVFISNPAEQVFQDPNASNEKKIATLLNMTEQNMAELFVQLNVTEETAASTEKVIRNYVHMMIDNPKSLGVLLKLVSHGEYLYYHSIAVAVFSLFVAKATGLFNQRMLELVGMGGFLHDIGCAQVSKDILDSPSELNAAEWNEIRSHPKLALQMIEKTPMIPDEVRYIVYQHHEEPTGNGYPNGLKAGTIYYPARIVALVDGFSALISKRPFRQPFALEQAIQILQQNTSKYDRDLVMVLSQIFMKQSQKAA